MGVGTKETPIALLDDVSDDAKGAASASAPPVGAPLGVGLNGTGVVSASAGVKRKSMDGHGPNSGLGGGGGSAVSLGLSMSPSQGSVGTAGGKKKRRVEIHPFHPELEAKLEELRLAVAKGASF